MKIYVKGLRTRWKRSWTKKTYIRNKRKFIFTYRGNDPIHTIKYLININVPFQMPYNDLKTTEKKSIWGSYETNKNQRLFLQLANGESVVLKEIKQLLKSIDPRYLGKNYSLEKWTLLQGEVMI